MGFNAPLVLSLLVLVAVDLLSLRSASGIYKDPNFPMADGRVHHLDVTHGEGMCCGMHCVLSCGVLAAIVASCTAAVVANRVLSVGDVARGERVAQHFDGKKYFKLVSHRGFVVYTGLLSGVRAFIFAVCCGLTMTSCGMDNRSL